MKELSLFEQPNSMAEPEPEWATLEVADRDYPFRWRFWPSRSPDASSGADAPDPRIFELEYWDREDGGGSWRPVGYWRTRNMVWERLAVAGLIPTELLPPSTPAQAL